MVLCVVLRHILCAEHIMSCYDILKSDFTIPTPLPELPAKLKGTTNIENIAFKTPSVLPQQLADILLSWSAALATIPETEASSNQFAEAATQFWGMFRANGVSAAMFAYGLDPKMIKTASISLLVSMKVCEWL